MPVKTPRRVKPTISATWRKILLAIPGYDAIATAGTSIFVPDKALHVLDFFDECLLFIEGDKGGKPFKLERWQQAIVANLYGWIRPDGTRRYREAFIYVPRKNGKTPLIAGLVLYGLFCEEEPGNQIYSAAATKEQASLIYRHAKGMMLSEPELKSRGEVYETSKTIIKRDSLCKYQALAADAHTLHGLNASMILVDELHTQPNNLLVDTLTTSVASRRQPLTIFITTADFDRPSICNEKLQYARDIQQGIFTEPTFLPVIYEAARDDDWTDEDVWAKANPNLGVSVSIEYMRASCQRAMDTPSYQNTFKRLHLNMQTTQDVRWIDPDEWDACHDLLLTPESLYRQRCYGGLDLGSTSDLCAFVLWFPDQLSFLAWFWLPEDTAQVRLEHARIPYPLWIQEGHISVTPGNVTDYDFVREDILRICENYKVLEIAVDKWNSTQMQTQLMREGLAIIQYAQSPRIMNAPTREIERLAMSKRLKHMGDPVTRWCVGNVVLDVDHDGNIKPSKERSNDKIDAITGLVMAMGRALSGPEKPRSVYEKRGLLKV